MISTKYYKVYSTSAEQCTEWMVIISKKCENVEKVEKVDGMGSNAIQHEMRNLEDDGQAVGVRNAGCIK